MSFFKSLFGGSESKNTNSASSGFSLLPKELQDTYKQYAGATSDLLPTAGAAFTPLGTTADEEAGYSAIRGGFAPTEASIGSDIAMQVNPFDTSVIDGINRQAGGEFSVLKGALDEAGAFGSNREFLGANDIDLTRLDQIGRFKQDQYNVALDNALTTMPSARANDATNLLSIGDRERGLDSATKQADIKGLLALAQAMGALPESGGSTSTGYGMTNDYGKGAVGSISGLATAFA